MPLLRAPDTWVALGICVLVLVGLKTVASQIHEGEKIDLEEAQRLQKTRNDTEKEAKSKREQAREPVDDDIGLEHLELLIRHPNFDIRRAATKILLHRVAASPACMKAINADFASFQERKLAGDAPGEFNNAAAVYDLADNHDINFPLRPQTPGEETTEQYFRRYSTAERQEEIVAIRSNSRSPSSSPRLIVNFVGRLSRRGAMIPGVINVTTDSPISQTQSPEELALAHWQRREAVVLESEDPQQVHILLPSTDGVERIAHRVADDEERDDDHIVI